MNGRRALRVLNLSFVFFWANRAEHSLIQFIYFALPFHLHLEKGFRQKRICFAAQLALLVCSAYNIINLHSPVFL